ncbi:MAG: hypothetical protein ACI9W2_001831 [Gammaproteobacteria bacterium]|jgi:hypothetical protein
MKFVADYTPATDTRFSPNMMVRIGHIYEYANLHGAEFVCWGPGQVPARLWSRIENRGFPIPAQGHSMTHTAHIGVLRL